MMAATRRFATLLPILLIGIAAASSTTSARRSSISLAEKSARDDTTPRPAVHLLSTGGTIASRPDENLTGQELVSGVPGLQEVARVSVEEFSNIGSSRMTPAHWLELARRIRSVFRNRPRLAGVVVTHGTDTMEETALFLHLTLTDPRPVVVTGAMRPPGTAGADGPANLLDAVRAAASPTSRGRGTLVAMNDELHRAVAVRKAHTVRPDAFESPAEGPVGEAGLDSVVYRAPAEVGPMRGRFAEALSWNQLPTVRIAYGYPGADEESVRALGGEGSVGLVVASVGRGNLSEGQERAVQAVSKRGIPVVMSSRTMAGPVPVGEPGDGIVGAGSLNPQQARVVLALALTETDDPLRLTEIFELAR